MLESNLFWNFVIIGATIIEWITFRFMIMQLSEIKTNKSKVNLSILGTIIFVSILNIVDFMPNIKLLIATMLTLIIYKYNFEVKLHKVVIVCAIYLITILGIDGLSVSIIAFINSLKDASVMSDENIFRLELILLSKVLLLLTIPILKNFDTKVKLKIKDFILIIIPILTNMASIVVIFGYQLGYFENSKFETLYLLICSIFLIISNLALVFILKKIISDYTIKNENEMIIHKIESQYNHYIELQSAQLRVRKLYHDMKNHLICIENMKNQEALSLEYINSIRMELEEWNSIKTTGNMIVDIILSEKQQVCRDKNINFIVEVNLVKYDFIDMMDMCSIFSNILDNAIEACDKIEDCKNRNIRIVSNIINKFLVIKCENSKVNNIVEKSNKIFTDKKDKFIHGIGINSIKTSVEKYNGTVAIDYNNEIFVINIYIPLSE